VKRHGIRTPWKRVIAEFRIDDTAGLLLLRGALEAFDRANQARKTIKAEGAVTQDRFGRSKAHPSVLIERDSRQSMIAALRALKLDPGAFG
jgi:phage terminase small subunit